MSLMDLRKYFCHVKEAGLNRTCCVRTTKSWTLRRSGIQPNSLKVRGYGGLVKETGEAGKDVSMENLHLGFTHVFESTFESIEGVAEYVAHPAHVEFSNEFLSALEKVMVIDYKPTTFNRPT
ncbi:hypothetical protein GIB67_032608 [Kingdonia uniflora]|uniref:Stress-response A/B barrel domain-containing protein n=1 Tax=Kingdonia uniflora TaxID=39325 RepID=A0A7J7L576_9MAGN|nr:hypothetical protein GIB67_032608 [Kingdonia uniflora]